MKLRVNNNGKHAWAELHKVGCNHNQGKRSEGQTIDFEADSFYEAIEGYAGDFIAERETQGMTHDEAVASFVNDFYRGDCLADLPDGGPVEPEATLEPSTKVHILSAEEAAKHAAEGHFLFPNDRSTKTNWVLAKELADWVAEVPADAKVLVQANKKARWLAVLVEVTPDPE